MGVVLHMPGEILPITTTTALEPGTVINVNGAAAANEEAIGILVTAKYNIIDETYEAGEGGYLPLKCGAIVKIKTSDTTIAAGDKLGVANGKAVKYDGSTYTQVIGVALEAPSGGYVKALLI